jgi:UDP-N-acetylglucosamine/UDP-N-acetylgalactosamine diphosphorylase
MNARRVQELLRRGVVLPVPESVEIGEEVNLERIAPGVVIHAGCRVRGARTSMGPGSVLGREAPLTLEDCQLGHGVELRGGYCAGSTFLDGVQVGSSAHIRPGTLLEEQASCAHAVGLKQTVFLAFVVTGSLANLCDLLVAGGRSRREHTEIGSSYVHFNFTPHNDKATASLVGDVPQGVFYDRPPIFLGGQGGLVGPARIAYGVVVPAGLVWRGDALEPDTMVAVPPSAVGQTRPFVRGAYRSIRRVVHANLMYIGNILALRAWYRQVRAPFMSADPYRRACWEGALERLDEIFRERIKRLEELAGKMEMSIHLARTDPRCALPEGLLDEQQRLAALWPTMRAKLETMDVDPAPAALLDAVTATAAQSWPEVVATIPEPVRDQGRAWLQRVVDRCTALWTTVR